MWQVIIVNQLYVLSVKIETW